MAFSPEVMEGKARELLAYLSRNTDDSSEVVETTATAIRDGSGLPTYQIRMVLGYLRFTGRIEEFEVHEDNYTILLVDP